MNVLTEALLNLQLVLQLNLVHDLLVLLHEVQTLQDDRFVLVLILAHLYEDFMLCVEQAEFDGRKLKGSQLDTSCIPQVMCPINRSPLTPIHPACNLQPAIWHMQACLMQNLRKILLNFAAE